MPKYEELKKTLQGLVDAKKQKQDEEESIRRARNDADRTKILEGIGEDVAKALKTKLAPVIEELVKNTRLSADDIKEAFAGAEITIPPINVPAPVVTVNVPRVEVPPIKVPDIKLPTINVPEQKVVFPASFKLDTDRTNPVPVILTDVKGAVYSISQFAGGGGGGGGKTRLYQEADTDSLISGFSILGESNDTLIPIQLGSGVSDRALRVVHATDVAQSVSFSGTVETRQVSGSVDSVYIVDAFGSQAVSGVWNPDNRLRVSVETGGSGLTDSELRAAHLDVVQMSGSVNSINVLQLGGVAISLNTGTRDAGTQRVTIATDDVVPISAGATLDVKQVSGSVDSINVLQWGGTAVAAGEGVVGAGTLRIVQAVDSTASVNVVTTVGLTDTQLRASTLDVKQVSGSVDSVIVNSFVTSLEVKQVSGSADSVSVLDFPAGTLIQTLQLSGSADSVVATGNIAHDGIDSGNPIKIGGIARTANPTAVAALDRVDATFDDLGRQVITPYQVRDLITTAYLALTNGTEATLLAGAASTLHDLVYVMGANQSDAAVDVDIRSGTAGAVIMSLTIPADSTAGVAPAVPIPQAEVAQAWTVDMADITGTTVNITALFVKNV